MTDIKKYFAVAKINFRYTTWIAYMCAGICAAAMAADFVVDILIDNTGDIAVSIYSMLYLIPLMAPIFIASVNYGKLMNIGVKKKTFLYGSLINYLIFAAAVSLVGVAEQYLLDAALNENGLHVYGLIDVFGWDTNIFTAFFSQFAFLMLVQTVIHTLVFMQTKWYGWVADVLIVVIVSVFTPIPALRAAEMFFFRFIIFIKPGIIQIGVCIALSALIYMTNLFYLKRRCN